MSTVDLTTTFGEGILSDADEMDDLALIDLDNKFNEEEEVNAEWLERKEMEIETVDELAALASAIGIWDCHSGDFTQGEYCYEAVARLEYLLKQEMGMIDEMPPRVSRLYTMCGEYQLVRNVLCPLLIDCRSQIGKYGASSKHGSRALKLAGLLIKILSRLSNPDLSIDMHYLRMQQQFKNEMISDDVLALILYLMADPVTVEADDRSELDNDRLELYLYLVRNILAIPNPMQMAGGAGSGSGSASHLSFLHDRCVVSMMREGVMDVCIELAANCRDESDTISQLLLDIFYHYFRIDLDEVASLLAHYSMPKERDAASSNSSSIEEREKRAQVAFSREQCEVDELKRLSALDKMQRKKQRRRHHKWGGVRRVKAIDGRMKIKLGDSSMNRSVNEAVRARRKAARFRPLAERRKRVYLNNRVNSALIYVSDKFIERALASLMGYIAECLASLIEHELRESKTMRRWTRLAYYLVEYYRVKSTGVGSNSSCSEDAGYSVSPVSCLVKRDVIIFVSDYLDSLIENRKIRHLGISGDQVEEAVHLYKELVRALHCLVARNATDNDRRQRGLAIFNGMAVHGRGVAFLATLLAEYKSNVNTKYFVALCIECCHFVFELLKCEKQEQSDSSSRSVIEPVGEDDEVAVAATGEQEQRDGIAVDDEAVTGIAAVEDVSSSELEMKKLFVTNRILSQYMYLLVDYASNSCELNGYLAAYLEMIADEVDDMPMLFQVTSLIVFNQIMHDGRQSALACFAYDVAALKRLKTLSLRVCHAMMTRAAKNPVLWCDALFFKHRSVLADITQPGSMTAIMQRRAASKTGRGQTAFDKSIMAINGMIGEGDGSGEDDFEEEYELKEWREWAEEEDEVLRQNYQTYADEKNFAQLLATVLLNELDSSREASEVNRRLLQLGLLSRRKRKVAGRRKGLLKSEQRRQSKWRRPDDSDWIRDIVKETFGRISQSSRESMKHLVAVLERFTEMLESSEVNCGQQMSEAMTVLPLHSVEFAMFEDVFVVTALKKLGLIAPSAFLGYSFWKIPSGYLLSDVDLIVQELKIALNSDDPIVEEPLKEGSDMEMDEKQKDVSRKRNAVELAESDANSIIEKQIATDETEAGEELLSHQVKRRRLVVKSRKVDDEFETLEELDNFDVSLDIDDFD